MKGNVLIWSGRALAWLWAGFWLWFGTMSALAGKHPLVGFAHLAIPGLLMLAAAIAVWKWPAAGGMLLVAEGLALGGLMLSGYLRPGIFLVLTLALPPVVAGVLLLLGVPRESRRVIGGSGVR